MHIGWKSARASLALLSFTTFSACQQNEATGPTAPSMSDKTAAVAAAGNVNGAAGQRPAFYEGELFTVNMKELPEDASAATLASNQSINEIYASNDLDEEQDF